MNALEMKRWMKQWRAAGPALEAFRAEELRCLSEAGNAAIASTFFATQNKTDVVETSGLVEQQALFLRARGK